MSAAGRFTGVTDMTRSKSILIMASLGVLLAAAPLGFAAGSGSSNSNDSGQATESPAKLKCKKGEIIKTVMKQGKKTKVCAPAVTGLLGDDDLFEQGRALAKEGHYDWALDVLALVENQNDPKVLNYIGYSHRKSGRLDTGITYYRKALALNPDFVLAREYLGEGYVAAGRVDLARIELDEIAARCGTSCSEYQDLTKAIALAVN
jgi:tetratricopeptide (TPR) repeat protein